MLTIWRVPTINFDHPVLYHSQHIITYPNVTVVIGTISKSSSVTSKSILIPRQISMFPASTILKLCEYSHMYYNILRSSISREVYIRKCLLLFSTWFLLHSVDNLIQVYHLQKFLIHGLFFFFFFQLITNCVLQHLHLCYPHSKTSSTETWVPLSDHYDFLFFSYQLSLPFTIHSPRDGLLP